MTDQRVGVPENGGAVEPTATKLPGLPVSALIVLAVSTLAVLTASLVSTRRGLDMTDESWYILWLQDPWDSGVSASLFSQTYWPAFWVLGEDIAVARAANVLLLMSLGVGLMARMIHMSRVRLDRLSAAILSIATGSTALLGVSVGLLTPNYNTLVLTGMLVAVLGATFVRKDLSYGTVSGLLTLAVGIVITGLAKPTSAILTALTIAVALLLDKRMSFRGLLILLASSAALLVSASFLVLDGPRSLIQYLGEGASRLDVLDAGYSFGDIVSGAAHGLVRPPLDGLLLCLALSAVTLLVLWMTRSRSRVVASVGMVLCLLMATVGAAAAWIPWAPGPLASGVRIMLIMGPVLGLAIGLTIASVSTMTPSLGQVKWTILALFVLPFAFALGTNNPLWIQASRAAVFWTAAILLLALGMRGSRIEVVLVTACMVISATGLITAGWIAHPYRQSASLPTFTNRITVDVHGHTLVVDAPTQRYAESLRSVANGSGFRTDDALLDLTGASPGASVLLFAHPLGTPWFLGNYPGSDAHAEMVLSSVDCARASRSWLLRQPGGPRALSDDVLGVIGADVSNYAEVGRVEYPQGGEQILMRPLSPAAMQEACEAVRAQGESS